MNLDDPGTALQPCYQALWRTNNTDHSQATYSQALCKLVHCSLPKSIHAISALGHSGRSYSSC